MSRLASADEDIEEPAERGDHPGRCGRSRKRATLLEVTSDTKWIIGTMVLLAGLMSAQFVGVNARIDDLRADMNARFDDMNARMGRMEARIDRIEARLDGLDERLRNVEIAFAKVDQRLLTLERIILPTPEPPDE